MTTNSPQVRASTFIVFPAIAMLLGWGLRGYIGGGPFGALIPGAFVALSLSLVFGHDKRTAGVVAMFGAIGIGYGGDMTYGQTLGFLRDPSTVWWGLLGVSVKGAVWGLLGGAVLAVGLTRRAYSTQKTIVALILTVAAFYLGWKLVNEPKLIYFSDPVNKPRDESWAGLLFAALVFIGFLRAGISSPAASLPIRFAFWGAIGGALGFGGGSLWMVFGPQWPVDQRWFGWWKFMEFSFGLIFGAFLGLAAWRNRVAIASAPREPADTRHSYLPVIALAIFVAVAFIGMEWTVNMLTERAVISGRWYAPLLVDLARLVGAFVTFAAISVAIGLRSVHAAWQIAVTLTFFHTVYDLVGDLSGPEPGLGFALPQNAVLYILLGATGLMALITALIELMPRAIAAMYLVLMWSCYAVASVRTFANKAIYVPAEGQPGGLDYFLREHPSALVVHAIFTASLLVTTLYIVRYARRESPVELTTPPVAR